VYLKTNISWVFFSTIANCAYAYADLDFLQIQLLEPNQEIVIASGYPYFDISFALLDFTSKVDSASTPEDSTTSQLSVLYPITERLKLGHERF
jgi:hypothetical protein